MHFAGIERTIRISVTYYVRHCCYLWVQYFSLVFPEQYPAKNNTKRFQRNVLQSYSQLNTSVTLTTVKQLMIHTSYINGERHMAVTIVITINSLSLVEAPCSFDTRGPNHEQMHLHGDFCFWRYFKVKAGC
eukprot:scaffold2068_cov96-Cylindrotheca_fusiformis.AAC.10